MSSQQYLSFFCNMKTNQNQSIDCCFKLIGLSLKQWRRFRWKCLLLCSSIDFMEFYHCFNPIYSTCCIVTDLRANTETTWYGNFHIEFSFIFFNTYSLLEIIYLVFTFKCKARISFQNWKNDSSRVKWMINFERKKQLKMRQNWVYFVYHVTKRLTRKKTCIATKFISIATTKLLSID